MSAQRGYLEGLTSKEVPSASVYLAMVNDRLAAYGTTFAEAVKDAAWRREMCRLDPLLFAIVYCSHIITAMVPSKAGMVERITIADLHLELCRIARTWVEPTYSPEGVRRVVVAARGTGKSAWMARILLLWACAYGYGGRRRGEMPFVVLFGATLDAVSRNWGDFMAELRGNALLRADFEHLTKEIKHPAADFATESGILIKTYSTASKSPRGLNIRNRRPTLMILDDIETDDMSPETVEKVVDWLRRVVPLLATDARILVAGTTAVMGGPVHQLLQEVQDGAENTPAEVLEWTRRYMVTWIKALIEDPSAPGQVRSHWPLHKPVGWLKQLRDSDPFVFALEMDNLPVATKGRLWDGDLMRKIEPGSVEFIHTVLMIDPAKKAENLPNGRKAEKHDYTAYVVASLTADHQVVIRYAHKDRARPGAERAGVIQNIYAMFPEIVWIWVEGNAAGDLVFMELEGLSGLVEISNADIQSVLPGGKEARIARAHQWYVRRRVLHEGTQYLLEKELLAYPALAHDDLPDALAMAVCWYMEVALPRMGAQQQSWHSQPVRY